ncbi:MAG: hypothetical protein ACXW25_00065 [Rhodospirillales bacterium]
MICDRPIGLFVVLVGMKSLLRHDGCAAEFFIPTEEPELSEVAAAPATQFLEPLVLQLIVTPPPHWPGLLCRRLELDERARGCTRPDHGYVWAPYARVSVLGNNSQSRRAWQKREHCFKQLVELWSKPGFRDRCVRPAHFPNPLRVSLEKAGSAHGLLLPVIARLVSF